MLEFNRYDPLQLEVLGEQAALGAARCIPCGKVRIGSAVTLSPCRDTSWLTVETARRRFLAIA